jgi:hypothetical protein
MGKAEMYKKLTDSEIIKALECCARPIPHCYCGECPAGASGGCAIKTENIIDLINRLQAENERLKGISDNKTKELLRYNDSIEELHKKLETAKAEAYKEFAERLTEEIINDIHFSQIEKDYLCVMIDNLLKEMVGEDK